MANIILRGEHGTYQFDPEDRAAYIGEGGMGRVFRGIDVKSGKAVAVKVLFRELTKNANNIERIKIESTVKIRHRNLIEMHGFVEYDGKYHAISEFLDGKELSTLIAEMASKGQTLSPDEVKRIVLAVAEGLEELHKNNLVHRDIKPSNIMVLKDGGIKLFDYGVIKKSEEVLQKLTSAGAIIGTIHYASPEQIRNMGGDSVGPATDIYSLGITMYEMMTGAVPFDGESEFAIMEKQTKEIIPPNQKLNKGCYNLLVNATAKEQQYRYKRITEFKDDLLTLPGGNIPLIRNAWWQTKPFKQAAAIIILVFAAVGAFFYFHAQYNKAAYAKNVQKGVRFYSVAQYDSARFYFANALNFVPNDTVQHKVMMLDALIPGMKDFYNASYSKAYQELQKAEKLGSGDADYYLGELSYNGLGTVKDYKKGWAFSNKAVKRSFNMAYWRIAYAYETGKGVVKDKDKSDKYYFDALAAMKKLSEAGDPEALGNLGGMYSGGSGVPRNEKIAFGYYLKAANTGYAFLECNLADMYRIGSGVERNMAEAVKWYKKSADKGHPEAQLQLGNMYLAGEGVPANAAEGLKLINKAANQNYSAALTKLGYLYYDGYYVTKDDARSFKYTKKAVDFDNDNTTAIENMAFNYTFGTGTGKDYAQARDYYLKAIEAESPNSVPDLVRIADLYYAGGYNLDQNEDKFVAYCKMAESYGSSLGRDRLGNYYDKKGIASYEAKNYAKARSYFKIALKEGHKEAANNLRYLDQNGYY